MNEYGIPAKEWNNEEENLFYLSQWCGKVKCDLFLFVNAKKKNVFKYFDAMWIAKE